MSSSWAGGGRRSTASRCLCFKFLAWPAFTAFFYWDLALLGACLAILVKLWRPADIGPRWSAALGACVGLAFVAKQSMGIYLGGSLLAWLCGRARCWAPRARFASACGRSPPWPRASPCRCCP